jgi:predicted alpha/beta hydrolase
MTVVQQSNYIDCGDHKLHVRHILPADGKVSAGKVLMIHGSIENGRIYYNEKGRGLGCYLARQGFEVFIPDLRGRGLSAPAIGKGHTHAQFESVTEDLPKLINHVAQNDEPIYCVTHSWGGTLLVATLLRHPELAAKVKAKVHFGVKRRIRVRNFERYFKIDLMWNTVAPIISRFVGYLPAVKLKMGADNEPHHQMKQVTRWFKEEQWVDIDGFDYHHANAEVNLPPSWFIGSEADYTLGAESDINLFMNELKTQKTHFTKLGKANGNQFDYDHINVLTHKLAEDDHFPEVSAWLKSFS